jgi:hypothetical protein
MDVMKFPRRLIRHLETPELPLKTLEAIHRLRRYLDELEAACILKARELGASPTEIGEALGITRQSVYNRLHNLEQRARTDPNSVIPDLQVEETEEFSTSSRPRPRDVDRQAVAASPSSPSRRHHGEPTPHGKPAV